jgi:hypothetical protein
MSQPVTKPRIKGDIHMAFLTPEEAMKKKKTQKIIMYISFFLITILLIAGTTYLTYQA